MKNYHITAGIGVSLVLFISIIYGFREMLIETVNHIIGDLTVELAVHAYIAGAVLVAYAAYLYARGRVKRKRGKRRLR